MTAFTITSDEGLPIRGNLSIPDKARALVVIVHGFKGFKDWGFFPWVAERLCATRFAACRFNMSRSGIGDDPESFDRLDLFEGDTYSTQLRDLECAVRYAQSHAPGLPTFLFGHSRGGGVALLGATHLDGIEGVITWSAISRVDRWDDATKEQWRRDGFLEQMNARTKQVMRMSTAMLDDCESNRESLDILSATRQLTAPLLVIHGGRDESVPVEEAGRIHGAAPDSSIMIIDGASHTYNAIHPLVHIPMQLSMAMTVTTRFINAYA